MTNPLGSTGHKGADLDTSRHTVVIEDIGDVDIPGASPLQQIKYQDKAYTHVGEDATGRWIYRVL